LEKENQDNLAVKRVTTNILQDQNNIEDRVDNMVKLKNILNEASEVQFKELKPVHQKQVLAFEKIIGGKHSQIFDGIHGMIVDIEARGNFGSGYRFGASELKKLLSLNIRWIESDGDMITIAF
jgi:hypothetical protein